MLAGDREGLSWSRDQRYHEMGAPASTICGSTPHPGGMAISKYGSVEVSSFKSTTRVALTARAAWAAMLSAVTSQECGSVSCERSQAYGASTGRRPAGGVSRSSTSVAHGT